MARKNLLKGLMEEATAASATRTDAPSPAPAPTADNTRVDVAKPRYTSGAIGAVSQSISDLKSRAIQDIPTDQIDSGGLQDRLDADDGLAELAESIAEHGQQVPVLLRPHPEQEGRFQIVYGRRRVAALRRLGQPVKALIRVLDDRALIVAQGQENSARRDLSFIERVNFARQMRDMDYERKVICDALNVDKTLISRMLSIADRIPEEVINAVGAAPGIGRDRWSKLAELLERGHVEWAPVLAHGDTSDARFEALFKALSPRKTPAPTTTLKSATGEPLGEVKRTKGKSVLTLKTGKASGFDEWLIENFQDLHARYLQDRKTGGS
ncbi:plasmid partitioning protein RepB [Phaeobacter sp. HF9A]|uniref:plasmid partitioning protein RepB n=1 Tax=Phaeobacter sp. HF9A TaxID=2721561 RepID=UPI001430C300|nr:plasmid partitioning protein RepB [Phaeobacter sp. HF9A]NIZ12032.1 plasmid partitioning protein RepB [Phaeobacter sp. HF9A]